MSDQLKFSEGQQQPRGPGSQSPEDLPLVYVVSSLTALDEAGRKIVDGWCEAIKHAIDEVSKPDQGGDAAIRCHTPITISAPWKTSDSSQVARVLTNEQVFELNFGTVAESDALIVLGHGGGGFGGGQEITWGIAARIPILFLYHGEEPVSKQVRGTPADMEFERFNDAAELELLVRQFIAARRSQLQAHARARRSRSYLYLRPMEMMREKWAELSEQNRHQVCARTGIHPRQIVLLLRDVNALALASIDELLALVAALGLRVEELFGPDRLPELAPKEMSALRMAAREFELTGEDVIDLQVKAQLEIARGGVRRLRLLSPHDWIDFRDTRS